MLSALVVAGIILQSLPAGAAPATVRQEINIINKTYTATNTALTSDEIVQLDTTAYSGTVSYYFEVVANTTASSTGNIALRRSGTSTNDATIALSAVGTTYTRYRTSAFTPPAGQTQYALYADAAGASKTLNIKAARIIISQTSDPITATETQIEIGNHETGKNNTATAPLNNPKYWKYTAANWNPAPTFYAEVVYKANIGTTPVTNTYASSQAVTIPAGVSQVTVEAWGAGGSGGNQGSSSGAAGGGGGGAFAKGIVGVTPGTYQVVVGVGAVTENGLPSFFGPNTTQAAALVKAAGGQWGLSSTAGGTGGQGGQVSDSIGNVVTRNGGTGANGQGAAGGGGGGGAGTNNSGTTATTSTGGTGGTVDGGNGGTGGANSNGTAGSTFGGGGGGSHRSSGNRSGGAGANGKVSVSYDQPAVGHSVAVILQEDDGNFGNWTNVTNGTIVTGGTSNTPTRVRTPGGFTPVDGRHYRTVTSITNSGSTYDVYNSKIIAASVSAGSWSEIQPAGNSNQSWIDSAISGNGEIMLAGVENGRLYRSVNGGTNWSEVQPAGNSNFAWQTLSISRNGQVMVAGIYNGRLYLSINGGTNWSEVQPLGNTNHSWYESAISFDGQTILVAGGGISTGKVFVSSNSGSTWAETQPTGSASGYWEGASISDDGQTMLIAFNDASVYRSSNSGVSWVDVRPAGSGTAWDTTAMNSDGSIMLSATSSVGRLYKSYSSANDWTETQPAGNITRSWRNTSISSNGRIAFASVINGRTYLSKDGITNWAEEMPAGNSDIAWNTSSMDESGQKIITGANGGRLYLYSPSGNVSKFETSYLLANTSAGASTGLKDYDTRWDPAEWSNVNNTYYHEVNGAASGTAGAKLQSNPNVTPIDVTNSAITNAIEVSRSTALTMPGSAQDLDVTVTNTGTLNASRMIVVVDTNTNATPVAPMLSVPANTATGISTTPTFQLSSTDTESDYLRYRIEVCTTSNCSNVLRTIDQTSSQTGWSGQNAQTSTAYTSGTTATHAYQAPALSGSTQYWWRASAIDPAGSNTWSTVSSINSFTTLAANTAPNAPTLSSPANSATDVVINPSFQLVTTDTDSDYLRYRIEVCSTSDCSAVVRTIDQTASQTGWSGQNTQTSTAYTSGTTASHIYQLPTLDNNTQYWWRAFAIDPGGTNTWSTASNINSFTTAAAAPAGSTSINGGVDIRGGTSIGN